MNFGAIVFRFFYFVCLLCSLVSCQQGQGTNSLRPQPFDSPTVTVHSSWLAEYSGVSINFQHPRSWQTSYFSDSGFAGWLVSDADPNEAFWYTSRTGEEIVLLIMPADDPSELDEFTADDEVEEFEEGGRLARFAISNGEVRGYVAQDDTAFSILGEFPVDKESDYKEGIETIFTTLTWLEVSDFDPADSFSPLGVREEGEIELGKSAVGYASLASSS